METVNMDDCCLRGFVKDECHKDIYRAHQSTHKVSSLPEEEMKLLYLRVPGLQEIEEKSICDYHYRKYITYYSANYSKCCDPWKNHRKNVTQYLRIINLDFAEKVKQACNIDIVPGQKFCSNCQKRLSVIVEKFEIDRLFCIDPFQRHRSKIDDDLRNLTREYIDHLKENHDLNLTVEHKVCRNCRSSLNYEIRGSKQSSTVKEEDVEEDSSSTASSASSTTSSEDSASTASSDSPPPNKTNSLKTNKVSDKKKQKCTKSSSTSASELNTRKRHLKDIFDVFDIAPVKRPRVPDKRLLQKGLKIVQKIASQVSETFQDVYNVKMPKLDRIYQWHNESIWLKKMIRNMQIKYRVSSYNERISLLTFLPDDWSLKQINEYFHCSEDMVSEANTLKQNIGKSKKKI
ncbi:hypothetical protein TKK_0003781 [Trichogramma kaykai]